MILACVLYVCPLMIQQLILNSTLLYDMLFQKEKKTKFIPFFVNFLEFRILCHTNRGNEHKKHLRYHFQKSIVESIDLLLLFLGKIFDDKKQNPFSQWISILLFYGEKLFDFRNVVLTPFLELDGKVFHSLRVNQSRKSIVNKHFVGNRLGGLNEFFIFYKSYALPTLLLIKVQTTILMPPKWEKKTIYLGEKKREWKRKTSNEVTITNFFRGDIWQKAFSPHPTTKKKTTANSKSRNNFIDVRERELKIMCRLANPHLNIEYQRLYNKLHWSDIKSKSVNEWGKKKKTNATYLPGLWYDELKREKNPNREKYRCLLKFAYAKQKKKPQQTPSYIK